MRPRRLIALRWVVRCVVMLALALRLLPAPAGAATADAWGGIPICHANPTGAEPAGSPAGKQDKTAHDCVLCPVCLTALDPALVAAHAAVAQAPTAWRAADDHAPSPAPDLARRTARHPARAPPIAV